MMLEKNMSYEVKDWFADRIANEVGHNISACDVFAILKETESAAYVMLSIGGGKRKCAWVHKSALEAHSVGLDEHQIMHYETKFIEDYEEAVKAFEFHWYPYR